MPLEYKDIKLDCGYRLDILVEDVIVVEVKAVSELTKIHEAPLLTYLKMSDCRVGLLMNFNVKLLREGIRRLIV